MPGNREKYQIVYHPSNAEEFTILTHGLGNMKIAFSRIEVQDTGNYDQVMRWIRSDQDAAIILLLNDNFLKSPYALFGMLETLRREERSRDIIPIICPGRLEEDGNMQKIPTDFSRMSSIIRYTNWWQDYYIRLRGKKEESRPEEFTQLLRVVRGISTEINDFLREINEKRPLSFKHYHDSNFIALAEIKLKNAPDRMELKEPEDHQNLTSILDVDQIIGEMDDPKKENPDEERPDLESLDLLFERESLESTEDEVDLITGIHRLMDAGSWAQALQSIDFAIETSPSNALLYRLKAQILAQETRNYPKALEALETYIALKPEHPGPHFVAGELAEAIGQFPKAFHFYKSAKKLDKHFPQVHYRLGCLLQNHFPEKIEKAAKYLKKAVKLDKANNDALYRLALARVQLHPDKAGKIMELFEEVLSQEPKHPFAHYDLALLHYRNQQWELARIHYKKASQNNPEIQTPQNDRAFLERKDTKNRISLMEQQATAALPNRIEKDGPKCVLITGATSGIGRATAELFAQNGYKIILTGRREDRLHSLSANLKENYSCEVHTLHFDVREYEACKEAVQTIPEDFNSIDILINNAGLAKGLSPIQAGNLEHWETMIDTNIKGLLYMTRLVSPGMVDRKSGHIINVCSTAGKEVYPNGNVYCATKHAVDALTRAMRIDLHTHRVRVSQVSPGHVEETEFAKVRFDGDAEKAKIYNDFVPLNARDVAEVIYFIASRPLHVNIQDVLMMGAQQANSNFIDRSGRYFFEQDGVE